MTGQLRITGGRLVRRRFRVPAAGVRPTGDRAREALFSSLGGGLAGARVLDLFAGSGALGIEALSRGAVRAVFVERDRKTAAVLRQNLEELGLVGDAEVHLGDARRHLSSLAAGSFDVIFVDPPYDDALDEALVAGVTRLLAPGGEVVLERRASGADPPWPGLESVFDRAYGDARLRRLAAPVDRAGAGEPPGEER